MPDLTRRSWFASLLALVGLRKIPARAIPVSPPCPVKSAIADALNEQLAVRYLQHLYERQEKFNRFLASNAETIISESEFRLPFTITRIDQNTKTVTLNTDIG